MFKVAYITNFFYIFTLAFKNNYYMYIQYISICGTLDARAM